MTNANDVRRAHTLLDEIMNGRKLGRHDVDHLRSFLPERPKQKTLEEITTHVLDAWSCTSDNYWGGDGFDPDISLEDWLWELHAQMQGLKDAPANTTAHPEFLETEADYAAAPEGTIVAIGDESPRMKYENVWPAYVNSIARNYDLSGTRRRILRWGWGE